MMETSLIAYVVFLLVGGILVFQWTTWQRKKRLGTTLSSVPPGFIRTEEVNIDPTTGVHQRIWYHPQTGERYYETLNKF